MSDTAVLLIAFGGPERMEDVRPFLDNVLRGRPVPQARIEEVVEHYAHIGGRSPLNELTRAQARALTQALEARGYQLPVVIGMRNWHPFIHDTLNELVRSGTRRIIALIMAAYNTEASDARYRASIDSALEGLGTAAPRIDYAPACGAHAGFVEANACNVARAFAQVPEEERAQTSLLFTAHSIPVSMAQASPYVAQLESVAGRVAEAVGHRRWRLCYQSRSGPPHEPWLEPDILAVLQDERAAGAQRVVVSPVGFVSDHVEVLYDLDVEARSVADSVGLQLLRAHAAGAHPAFIHALADSVAGMLPEAPTPAVGRST